MQSLAITWDLVLTLRKTAQRSEVSPAGPPATAVSSTHPPYPRCPAPASMVSPLICFVATEPVTLYAMLLL